jgi:hypothetical protein
MFYASIIALRTLYNTCTWYVAYIHLHCMNLFLHNNLIIIMILTILYQK